MRLKELITTKQDTLAEVARVQSNTRMLKRKRVMLEAGVDLMTYETDASSRRLESASSKMSHLKAEVTELKADVAAETASVDRAKRELDELKVRHALHMYSLASSWGCSR